MEKNHLQELCDNFSIDLFEKISSEWEKHNPLSTLSSQQTNKLFFEIADKSLLNEKIIDYFKGSNLTIVSLKEFVIPNFKRLDLNGMDFFYQPSYKKKDPIAKVPCLSKEMITKIFQLPNVETIILVTFSHKISIFYLFIPKEELCKLVS